MASTERIVLKVQDTVTVFAKHNEHLSVYKELNCTDI